MRIIASSCDVTASPVACAHSDAGLATRSSALHSPPPLPVAAAAEGGHFEHKLKNNRSEAGADTTALSLYASQLALNWAWTPIFFGSHNLKLASLEIAALWVNVAACGLKFYSINKTAGLLFLPYLAWVSLASALTFTIWRKNGDHPEPVKKE